MNNLKFESLASIKRTTGLSYLGSINSSAKIRKNGKYGEYTYIIYLAPASMSGYNVCKGSTAECRRACLHSSGQNRINNSNHINKARIKKTQMFFENRELFMNWLVTEIIAAKNKAERDNKIFSVRLNGTSDISPVDMALNGKNILEIFPDVQFYDYTKIFNRYFLTEQYNNYDLTYSFNGYNWELCKRALKMNMRVAVVFENELPDTFDGFKVINGDNYDMRYVDPKNAIVGLKFKKVKEKIQNSPFIITPDDHRYNN